MSFAEQIERALDEHADHFGSPSARKSGRRAEWPYTPVVVTTYESGNVHRQQVLGKAFATREEAVDHARAVIARHRGMIAEKLADRRYRALREQFGLPRELPA